MTDEPSGPPFPVELIADLHSGVLPDDVAEALWPRVRADPDAMAIVAALDATRADLAAAPITPEAPPPAVISSIESTLAAIRAETEAAAAGTPVDSIDDARDRQRDARRRRGMVRASIAAGIIAVVTLVIAVATATMSSKGTDERADDAGTSVSTPSSSADAPIAPLSYVGRSEATFTGRSDPQRLRRCLTANGVAASVQVLGSGPVTVDGQAAVVVLLSTGVAGQFDALVVRPDCDSGTPATLSRRTLGAPAPTG